MSPENLHAGPCQIQNSLAGLGSLKLASDLSGFLDVLNQWHWLDLNKICIMASVEYLAGTKNKNSYKERKREGETKGERESESDLQVFLPNDICCTYGRT